MSRPKMSQQEFIRRANIAHNNKYDYSATIYTTMHSKLLVICPIHGVFNVEANNHIKNWNNPHSPHKPCGCGLCGREFTISRNISGRLSQEVILTRFKAVHNSRYNYSKVEYHNYETPVVIGCNIHGDFNQRPDNHLAGTGCPRCKNSQGQNAIENFLISTNITYFKEHSFPDCKNPNTNYVLKYDFYLPDHNTLIEYDGEQHFKPTKFHQAMTIERQQHLLKMTQFRDHIKTEYAKQHNINLIRISYLDKNNIQNILTKI